jgi:hypothetical protein
MVRHLAFVVVHWTDSSRVSSSREGQERHVWEAYGSWRRIRWERRWEGIERMWVHRLDVAMMSQTPYLMTCLCRVCNVLNYAWDDGIRQYGILGVDERRRWKLWE